MAIGFNTFEESALVSMEPCVVHWVEWYNTGATAKFTLYDATYADPTARQLPREGSATQQIGHVYPGGVRFTNGLYLEMAATIDYVIVGYEILTPGEVDR